MAMLRKTVTAFENYKAQGIDYPCTFRMLKIDEEKPYELLQEQTFRQDIEVECLGKILDDFYKSLKMVLVLPNLLARPQTLQTKLIHTEYADAIGVTQKYIENLFSTTGVLGSSRKSIFQIEDSIELDNATIRFIDYYASRPGILDHLKGWNSYLTPYDKDLLRQFKVFMDLASHHLQSSGLKHLMKEKFIHEKHEHKTLRRTSIMGFAKCIKACEKEYWKQRAQKEQLIQHYYVILTNECAYMDEAISEGWIKLKEDCIKTKLAARQVAQKLDEDLEAAKKQHEDARKKIFKELKTAQEEKDKWTISLLSVLDKYDTTISEKFRENIRLKEEYEIVEKQHRHFMIGYRQLERVYLDTVVARRKQEEAELEARALVFRMHKSAIKIQRWWRRIYKELKREAKEAKAKKGASKGKKKK